MARSLTDRGTRRRESAPVTARHIPLAQSKVRVIGRRFEEWRPLWVAALLPLFLFGEGRYAAIGVVVACGLWAWAGWATGIWGQWTSTSLTLLLLLALAAMTIWITPSAALSREQLAYFLAELLAS